MRTVPDVKLPDVKPYAGNPHVLAYVVIAILGFYCMASTMLYLNYVRPDYRALLCLTRCDRETEVLEFFGRDPEIVYFKGDKMPPLGWKLPYRPISHKVLVYTNPSALRFYVYVDGHGQVEYVYTANS